MSGTLDPQPPGGTPEEERLRPARLADFHGQPRARRDLEIALTSARTRDDVMPHVLLYGPPGLGKTTLAHIIAEEMGVGFKSITAPAVKRAADLASVLVTLGRGDVLFIDEIHRLNADIAELLYPPMEDFRLNILQQEAAFGPSQSISLDLAPFTLVGATTKAGDLERPFRQRFSLAVKLELYDDDDLARVVRRSAPILGTVMDDAVALDVARRSRGTPRIANSFLQRIRDYAITANSACTAELVAEAFEWLRIEADGLDDMDRRYLDILANRFRGGPVGIETLAVAIGEDATYIAEEVEPWLVLKGLVDRTPRGRTIGQRAG